MLEGVKAESGVRQSGETWRLFTNLKGFTLAHAFSSVSFEGPLVMDDVHPQQEMTASLCLSSVC